jgi:hypothetical protein
MPLKILFFQSSSTKAPTVVAELPQSGLLLLDRKESKLSYVEFHLVGQGVQRATPGKRQRLKQLNKAKKVLDNVIY